MTRILCRFDGSHLVHSRRRLGRAALALTLAVSPLLAARPAHARPAESRPASLQEAYVHADTIQEVLSRWRPETHLYVLGDAGLEEDALQELAGWLGNTHWTVLLVQDASGQTYTDIEGRTHSGEDAIEYGTGQGIPRQAGFSAQVHPRNGEPDGAIFTIVLAQRALFYTGSQAQDSRSLGEDRFPGELDRWAIEAMRSGGDVVTAVKETVGNIDLRVDRAIASEFEGAERSLAQAATALTTLEERAAALRKAFPNLSGPLVQPDVQGLRQQLARAESLLRDDPGQASRSAVEIRSQALAQIRAIEEYPSIGKALETAQARLADLERRERAAAARQELATARQGLASARELHTRGTSGYTETLAAANDALSIADKKISSADSRAAFRRFLIRFLLFLLAAALAGTGFALNRRRRGVKREAEELLAAWRAALDKKLEILLDELERRVVRYVGPASGEGRRPWAGETLRLAERIRADVGSLYILWTSASSVLQKAEALIRARGLGALFNFFLPGNYRRGIALLKDEPVPFDPADGLPKLFGHERTWRDDLLGDLASYEPFRKSFQELVGELNLRAARAAEALNDVESAVVQGPSALEETEERIRQAQARREEIERAGSADGLFLAPALFATALPAAAAALARAQALFPTDPVGSLREDGAEARRIAVDASQLAGLIVAARHGALPAVEAGAAALREASIGTGWIDAGCARLSGMADLLAAQAAEAPVSAGIEELAQGLADLGSRVERAAALSGVLEQTARPEVRRVTALVESARGQLGGSLGLPPDRLLREEDSDPSARLEGSDRQAGAAQASLGRGELDAAEAALAEAVRLTAEAEVIVEATRQAFAAHAATVEERRAETVRVEGLLPEHDRILAGIREVFAPSVLSLRSGDPEHPDANGTLADNLEEARAHVGFAHEKLDRAVAAHRVGKLLASAGLLREVKEHQEIAVHRMEEIAERRTRLERTVESNRSLLEILESRVREDQIAIAGDPRTMQPTMARFEEGRRQFEQARRAVEATPGDPLIAEDGLLAANAILAEVHDRMAPGDRTLHAEADKSVEAAARQLESAGSLARRAAGDGVPDSPAMVLALRNLESLAAAQARAREALGVHHGDWNAFDAEADWIAAEAAHSAATLTGEIAAAEKATAAISSAAAWVRHAGSWHGGYGVSIPGSPGSGILSQARSLLEQGRYEEAGQAAVSAAHEASEAVAVAEAAVRRRRAEEERRDRERREEERRRREAKSVVSSGISRGSSFGSGRSSSSGSSRSSWGSSRSGSGKSGW